MVVALIMGVQNFCNAAVEIKELHLNGEENLKYPEVQTGNKAIDEKINLVIAKEVDHFVTKIYDGLSYDRNDSLRYIDTNYKITCNEAGGTKILSMIIDENYCYMRAAHPAYIDRTFNFDTTTGELIDKNRLINLRGVSESDLLDRLTQKLREHCESRNIPLYYDALPLKKLPDDFYWDENLHLHFIFQHYDVASYAFGILNIDIDA